MTKNLLENNQTFNALFERLMKDERLARKGKYDEPEAATLINSLRDIEESCRAYLDEHLPKILDESLTSEQLKDVIQDAAMDFGHIVYHVRDSETLFSFTALNFEDQ